MGTLLPWNRAQYSNGGTAVPWSDHYQIAALFPNQSVRRIILGMNQAIGSTQTTFLDQGVRFAFGVSVGTSPTAPPGYPLDNANTAGLRWLYWDQVQYDPINAQVIAGQTSYLARNTERSQYVDIANPRHRNVGTTNEYLWWSFQAEDDFTPAAFTWAIAATAQTLVETFP